MKRRSLLGAVATLPVIGFSFPTGWGFDNDNDNDNDTDDDSAGSLPISVEVLEIEGTIERGQPTATYAIGNSGDESVYVPVEVVVDGSVVQEKDVVVAAGGIETFTASWFTQGNTSGSYTYVVVRAGDKTARKRSKVRSLVYPTIYDVTWVDDEHVEVTYGAENRGSSRDSSTVELRRNQVPTESHDVTLDPGESVRFTDTMRVWDGMVRVTVVTDISMAKELTAYCADSE